MRLDHFLALASIGTKNKVRAYIYAGHVTVNNTLCMVPSEVVNEKTDSITFLGTPIFATPVYYVLNKPQNCMTAREVHAYTVFDCLSDINTTGLFALGRLDKDTEGLLFLTNDGDFSNQLMDPDHHVTKTYHFLALGTLTQEKIATLENGMNIGDDITTKPASIHLIKSGLYSDLSREIGLEKMKKIKRQPDNQVAFLGEIIITEGKKHQVKRMLRGISCPIIYLNRVAIGNYKLPNTLALGSYLQVSKADLLYFVN